jgi:hypothetical protein
VWRSARAGRWLWRHAGIGEEGTKKRVASAASSAGKAGSAGEEAAAQGGRRGRQGPARWACRPLIGRPAALISLAHLPASVPSLKLSSTYKCTRLPRASPTLHPRRPLLPPLLLPRFRRRASPVTLVHARRRHHTKTCHALHPHALHVQLLSDTCMRAMQHAHVVRHDKYAYGVLSCSRCVPILDWRLPARALDTS